MSLSEERRNKYTQKPLKLVLNKNELRMYEWMAQEFYATQEGQDTVIDTDFHMSDVYLGKVN